jgi:hypothetical protein
MMSAVDEMIESYNPPTSDLVTELALLLRAVAESAAMHNQPNVEDVIETDLAVQARFSAFSRLLKDTLNVEPALIEYAREANEQPTKIISKDAENSRGWPVFRRIA